MKTRKKKEVDGVTVSGDPPALGSSLRPKGDHRPPRTAPSPKAALGKGEKVISEGNLDELGEALDAGEFEESDPWIDGILDRDTPKPPKRKEPFVDGEPMAPGRKLRTIRDDFPPIHDRKITLILFGTEYHPRFATTAGAKLELLDSVVEDPLGKIVAVWSGKFESHAFDVTDEIAARWVMELSA